MMTHEPKVAKAKIRLICQDCGALRRHVGIRADIRSCWGGSRHSFRWRWTVRIGRNKIFEGNELEFATAAAWAEVKLRYLNGALDRLAK